MVAFKTYLNILVVSIMSSTLLLLLQFPTTELDFIEGSIVGGLG